MPLYIDVDFHPHQLSVCICNTDDDEVHQTSLVHKLEQVGHFYEQFSEAIVGVEASCSAQWLEKLLSELGRKLKVGNPRLLRVRARSRHKSDERDAQLILDLLLKDEFPELWRHPAHYVRAHWT